MVRDTSIDVYNQIKAEGLLTRLKYTIYDHLYWNGPLTLSEACKQLEPIRERSITPRFAELKAQGAIREIGKRICKVSGREVYLWDVTSNVPKKIEKTKKGPTIKELFAELDTLREKVRLYEIELAGYRSEPAQKELFR